jgi:hypothetical protein
VSRWRSWAVAAAGVAISPRVEASGWSGWTRCSRRQPPRYAERAEPCIDVEAELRGDHLHIHYRGVYSLAAALAAYRRVFEIAAAEGMT